MRLSPHPARAGADREEVVVETCHATASYRSRVFTLSTRMDAGRGRGSPGPGSECGHGATHSARQRSMRRSADLLDPGSPTCRRDPRTGAAAGDRHAQGLGELAHSDHRPTRQRGLGWRPRSDAGRKSSRPASASRAAAEQRRAHGGSPLWRNFATAFGSNVVSGRLRTQAKAARAGGGGRRRVGEGAAAAC